MLKFCRSKNVAVDTALHSSFSSGIVALRRCFWFHGLHNRRLAIKQIHTPNRTDQGTTRREVAGADQRSHSRVSGQTETQPPGSQSLALAIVT